MKKIITIFAFALGILPSLFAQPFTDGKAVMAAAYDKAGTAKLEETSYKKVGTLVISSEMGDMTGTFTQITKDKDHRHLNLIISTPMGDQDMTAVITPEKAWITQAGETQEVPAEALNTNLFRRFGVGVPKPMDDATYTFAEETVAEKAVYAVTFKVPSDEDINIAYTWYYDKETLRLVAQKLVTGNGTINSTFEDYQEMNGVWVAHKIVNKSEEIGNENYTVTFEKIELGVTVDDAIFNG
jgi:hypothetical protein